MKKPKSPEDTGGFFIDKNISEAYGWGKFKIMKRTKRPIDLTMFDELWDTCGDMPLKDNLMYAFEYLLEKRFRNGKFLRSQKVKVLVSKVKNDENGDPFRYGSPKVVTISRLLYEWECVFHNSFSKESLADAKEKERFHMACLEKAGERRAAWGAFSATVRFQNQIREEKEFNNSIRYLNHDEQRRKKSERENRIKSDNLVIG